MCVLAQHSVYVDSEGRYLWLSSSSVVEPLHQLEGTVVPVGWVLGFLRKVLKGFLVAVSFYSLVCFQAAFVFVGEVNIKEFVF